MILPKNIQLSEKLSFLLQLGVVDQSQPDLIVFKPFEHTAKYFNAKYFAGQSMRLLKFVNFLIKKNELYPLLQKFVISPSQFKTLYISSLN